MLCFCASWRQQGLRMLLWLVAVILPISAAVVWPNVSLGQTQPAPLPATASPTAAPAASAQAVRVEAKLLQPQPKFGVTVDVQITLRYPKSVRVFFPARPDLRPLLLLGDQTKTERTETADQVTETITLRALAVRVGLLRTPAIEIPWHTVTQDGGAGETGTAVLAPLRIVVRSQFAAETDPKPAPLPQPRPLIEDNLPLQIGLALAAAMGVAALLTWLGVRVADRRAARKVQPPKTPAHVIALRRLSELATSGDIEREEPRLYYAQLSEILREYLGNRYGIHALDMTSSELLAALQSLDLRGVSLEQMQHFAEFGDLVKFARLPATPEELAAQEAFVRAVVDRTLQSAEELEQLRKQEQERLARQRQLRLAVLAPPQLRLLAFGLDAVIGALGVALLAWAARSSGLVWLWELSWLAFPLWLAVRDALGGASPGKVLLGLQIATADVDDQPAAATSWQPRGLLDLNLDTPVVQEASWSSKLLRNVLFLLPVAGWLAEALTGWLLPEHRRLGDQWGGTSVIDGRYGYRNRTWTWRPGAVVLVLAAAVLGWTCLQGEPDPRLAEKNAVVVVTPPGQGPAAGSGSGSGSGSGTGSGSGSGPTPQGGQP